MPPGGGTPKRASLFAPPVGASISPIRSSKVSPMPPGQPPPRRQSVGPLPTPPRGPPRPAMMDRSPIITRGNGRQPSPSAPPKGPPPRGPPPRNSIRLGPGPPGGQPPGQYLGRPSFSQSTSNMLLHPCSTFTTFNLLKHD